MVQTSKAVLLALAAAGMVASSMVTVSPVQARDGENQARPTMQFMQGGGARFGVATTARTRVQYACAAGYRCYRQVEPSPIHAEPGSFWHAISICDYLDGSGISCVFDPNYVDDNN